MDKPFKFVLPPPNFNKNVKDDCKPKPHYLTPSGMSLLPREKQPPPMYGKHGSTLPARYLKNHAMQTQQETIEAVIPEKHYCEPCEIELHSLDDLKRHRAQHEKCPVAGCLYKGHPSVMDKHINSLHASGLFDKFKRLSTPEEIAAWREERRKRYPTLANVLLKQKAKEQRQKRGERLEDRKNRFGKDNNRKRCQPDVREDKASLDNKKPREENKKSSKANRRRKNRSNKNLEIKPKVQKAEKIEVLKDDTELSCCGVSMFRGTSQLKNYKHFNEKQKAATTNALFGLVGMYGSDDDQSTDNDCYNVDEVDNKETVNVATNSDCHSNNDLLDTSCKNQDFADNEVRSVNSDCIIAEETLEAGKEISSSTNNIVTVGQESSTLVSNFLEETTANVENVPHTQKEESSDDEAPEETPIQRTMPDFPLKPEREQMPTPSNESKSKCVDLRTQKKAVAKQKQIKRSGLNYRHTRLRKQNTLLEKLLESDIRHERNVLLQCVRYVCEQKYFNIGQSENQKNIDKNKL